MADVVEHDFGKSHREAARSYGRLVGIVEQQAEAFIGNPTAFFEDAGERIVKLQMVFRNAERALFQPVKMSCPEDEISSYRVEMVQISKDEYDRLKECARIVREAIR